MGLLDIFKAIEDGLDFVGEITKPTTPQYKREREHQSNFADHDVEYLKDKGINFQRKPTDKDMMIQELLLYMYACTKGMRPPNINMVQKYERWASELGVPDLRNIK